MLNTEEGDMLTVAVVGLGYVGLPLVAEFGKRFRTIGFDIFEHKVASCSAVKDPSRELSDGEMRAAGIGVWRL
jgi:UDP-N-acetyl-D-galactosamine dehydrogenase